MIQPPLRGGEKLGGNSGETPQSPLSPTIITLFEIPGTSSIPQRILDSESMLDPGIGFFARNNGSSRSWCDMDFPDLDPFDLSC